MQPPLGRPPVLLMYDATEKTLGVALQSFPLRDRSSTIRKPWHPRWPLPQKSNSSPSTCSAIRERRGDSSGPAFPILSSRLLKLPPETPLTREFTAPGIQGLPSFLPKWRKRAKGWLSFFKMGLFSYQTLPSKSQVKLVPRKMGHIPSLQKPPAPNMSSDEEAGLAVLHAEALMAGPRMNSWQDLPGANDC